MLRSIALITKPTNVVATTAIVLSLWNGMGVPYAHAESASDHKGYRLVPIQKNAGPSAPYTASVKASVGTWTLEYEPDDCDIHSTCDASLYLTKTDGKRHRLATVSIVIGSAAVLSLDFRTIWTDEITESDHGVVGVVDVTKIGPWDRSK
jgi:hypothetical protein